MHFEAKLLALDRVLGFGVEMKLDGFEGVERVCFGQIVRKVRRDEVVWDEAGDLLLGRQRDDCGELLVTPFDVGGGDVLVVLKEFVVGIGHFSEGVLEVDGGLVVLAALVVVE